jgi:uncharacterized protein YoaH (UPF0181 family)
MRKQIPDPDKVSHAQFLLSRGLSIATVAQELKMKKKDLKKMLGIR